MHIFFATDGSASAHSAEQVLATFPFAETPRLTIATVCPAPDLHSIQSDVTAPVTSMLEHCRTEAAKLLTDTAERCKSWTPKIDRLLLDGHPAEELLKAIDRLYPDFVVVGARGLGAVKRMLLGSVSERIAKHASCSVLVIHPRDGNTRIRSIVAAYDGSPAAAAAIDRLAELPLGLEHSVHLLGVAETMQVYGTETMLEGAGALEVDRQAVAQRLQLVAERLRGSAGTVASEVRTSSDVAGAILDAAERHHADLIVLGSRGKSLWERFLLGSVTVRVLHHAPCSVWVERHRT